MGQIEYDYIVLGEAITNSVNCAKIGKNPKDKMKKLLESVGKEVNREYIYEEISGGIQQF